MNSYVEWAVGQDISSGPYKVLVKIATMVDSDGKLRSPHKLSLIVAQVCDVGQLTIENHLKTLCSKGVIGLTTEVIDGNVTNTLSITQ